MKITLSILFVLPFFLVNVRANEVSPDIPDWAPSKYELLVLDSVIVKDNNTTVLKYRKYSGELAGVDYRNIDGVDFTTHTYTLSNHPLLNGNTPVSTIKAVAPQGAGLLVRDDKGDVLFLFDNPLSDVTFVGFKE